MVTLNTFAFDSCDAKLLTGAFNQLKNKEQAVLVDDEEIKKKLLARVTSGLTMPKVTDCQFQNLLEFNMPYGKFYIAQILLDYGFPVGRHSSQSFDRIYHFQTIGFAEITIDFGKTFIRPELKVDNILFGIFNKDIELNNAEKFNEQYYLTSNKKETVLKNISSSVAGIIAKYNNMLIHLSRTDMYITFADTLENNQMRAIEEIFCACDFLKKGYSL